MCEDMSPLIFKGIKWGPNWAVPVCVCRCIFSTNWGMCCRKFSWFTVMLYIITLTQERSIIYSQVGHFTSVHFQWHIHVISICIVPETFLIIQLITTSLRESLTWKPSSKLFVPSVMKVLGVHDTSALVQVGNLAHVDPKSCAACRGTAHKLWSLAPGSHCVP